MSSATCKDAIRYLEERGCTVTVYGGIYTATRDGYDEAVTFGSNLAPRGILNVRRDAERHLGITRERIKRDPKLARERQATARTQRDRQNVINIDARRDARAAKSRATETFEAKAHTITDDYRAKVGPWALTNHALARMLQYSIHARDVLAAIEHPRAITMHRGIPQLIGTNCTVILDRPRRKIITVIP